MITKIGPDVASKEATVFIVDDDQDVRRSISLLMRSVNLLAEQYASATSFLEAFDERRPGCLILDVRMPGMTGIELQQYLLSRDSQIPIIMLSAHGDIPLATQVMRDGAVDFLQKPYNPHLLLERTNQSLKLDADRRGRQRAYENTKRRLQRLSPREDEVMELFVDGKNSKQIASQLGISHKTVDNHRASILEKLELDSTPQLVALVIRANVLRPTSRLQLSDKS